MLRWLPRPLLGLVTGAVILIHLIGIFTFLFLPPLVLKALSPTARLRRRCSLAMSRVGHIWGRHLHWIFQTLHRPQWRLEGVAEVEPAHSYLLICNHQSWADIMILAAITQDRIPFFRFFIKYELLWVPIIGVACWGMDCPFMKRPNRKAIQRNPALADADLRATRIACEKLRGLPVTIVNYVEGTRYTAAKAEAQNTPYSYLLKPKSGGVALVLNSMSDQLEGLLDVTMVYPDGIHPGLWAFLCGRLDPVHIHVQQREIPRELCQGDYRNDPEYRVRIQSWLSGIWQDKDARIAAIHANARAR